MDKVTDLLDATMHSFAGLTEEEQEHFTQQMFIRSLLRMRYARGDVFTLKFINDSWADGEFVNKCNKQNLL